MSFREALAAGKFVVTAEVAPPKGTDIGEIIEVAGLLKGRVDAANITDQQSSVMRLGSMAVCHILKDEG
ncbi:MAG: 5,10-methylenetetrahydrofolate reductase, partial [Dehalococcoidales bacterium]